MIQDGAHIAGHLFWLALVMPNAINYNYWEVTSRQWNGFLASMPVNHYWYTTFPTSQHGFVRLRYHLVSGSEPLSTARPLNRIFCPRLAPNKVQNRRPQ